MLNIEYATVTFYVLEEITNGLRNKDRFKKSIDNLHVDTHEYREEFNKKFAKTLFDYVSTISFAEARHLVRQHAMDEDSPDMKKFIYGTVFEKHANVHEDSSDAQRNFALKTAKHYDPREFLPHVAKAFKKIAVGDESYCGPLWHDIAKAGTYYWKYKPEVFIDHVIDLEHNSGCIFDKEYIVAGSGDLEAVLDIKKLGSLITQKEDYFEFGLDSNVHGLLDRAVALKIVKPCTHTDFFRTKVKFPKPIKFGDKSIYLKAKK